MKNIKAASSERLAGVYYRSKRMLADGGPSSEYLHCLSELSDLLNCEGDLKFRFLPFVSRIKRNLTLTQLPRLESLLQVSNRTVRKPKLVIITAVWKRYALTELFYQYYSKLKAELSAEIEIDMIVAGSEGALSRNMAEAHGFTYVEAPNHPLSEKWQFCADTLRGTDFDAAVIVGSDDFLSQSVFKSYLELYLQGANAVGFTDGHFYDVNSERMLYWKGYGGRPKSTGMPERLGESIGMGRMLSRSLLEAIDFQVWSGDPINKSLDRRMMQNLAKLGFLHVEYEEIKVGKFRACIPYSIVTLRSDGRHMLLDVKHETNVTKFSNYSANSVAVNAYEDLIQCYFGADLLAEIKSLK